MAIVKFIRMGGRIIPIRAPMGGKLLQAAHGELAERSANFAQKASVLVKKSKKLAEHAQKFASAPGGKFLHVSAMLNSRSEHKINQAAKAMKISSTLENYRKVAATSAHLARNKGKYALGTVGVAAAGAYKLNENQGGSYGGFPSKIHQKKR